MRNPIVNEQMALTGLRGVAVAIVVLSHLGNGALDPLPWLRLNAIGKAGVWLFFALSAFLLTTHLSQVLADSEPTSPKVARYGVNRVFRIFPLYIIVLGTHVAWGDMPLEQFFRHIVLIEGMWELWAIPVEFQFYLVIPLIALLHAKRGAGVATLAVVLMLSLSLGGSLLRPEKVFSNDLDLLYRLPPFAVGSLAGIWLPQLRGALVGSVGYAAVVTIGAAVAMWLYRLVVLDTSLTLLWPLVSMILALVWCAAIVGAANERSILARALAVRPLVFMGRISFSVYLLHMFAIRYWMEHGAFPPWAVGWLSLLTTMAVATLTYLAIERPGIQAGHWLAAAMFRRATPVGPAAKEAEPTKT